MDASRIVALLGPTNTGKTHRAIERLLEHESGMIGLPLRLLAREVYDRITSRIGRDGVALVTGEEKIVPPRARYFVCTVEAMPVHKDLEFVAVDEIQLAAHRERGHVFTDRLLHARGRNETWFLGADTMRPLVRALVPTAQLEEHPRLSRLTYAGPSKLSRMPPRSAVVAFSMDKVYELGERLRAMRGGAAIVLGALSPRTRNAQVAMFQAGEVEHIVATDAIGMGLNLELSHVAFAARHKFDGHELRDLEDAELAQIAGRAGRYVKDGTFGTVAPLELSVGSIRAVETHHFAPIRRLRYRPHLLDFTSPEAFLDSLRQRPPHPALLAVERADDSAAFERLAAMPEVRRRLAAGGSRASEEAVRLLWEVASIPDFRKLLFEAHVDDLRRIFLELGAHGVIRNDFLVEATRPLSHDAGDVEVLLGRITALRTWTYVAHKDGWVEEAEHWKSETRALEDRLSDALHAALTRRFVEETSKKRRGGARPLPPSAAGKHANAGDAELYGDRVKVRDDHPFAKLRSLVVSPSARRDEPLDDGPTQLESWVEAPHDAFALDDDGTIRAGDRALGRLARGPRIVLPAVRVLDHPDIGPGLRIRLERRLLAFARDSATRLLGPIDGLSRLDTPTLRGLGHLLEEGLGTVLTDDARLLLASLTPLERTTLEARGLALGRLSLYAPWLLKPHAIRGRARLLKTFGLRVPAIAPGRTSFARQGAGPVWIALGYLPFGPRVVRADVAERAASIGLADADANANDPSRRGKLASILGCTAKEAERVIRAMRSEGASSSRDDEQDDRRGDDRAHAEDGERHD